MKDKIQHLSMFLRPSDLYEPSKCKAISLMKLELMAPSKATIWKHLAAFRPDVSMTLEALIAYCLQSDIKPSRNLTHFHL
ncbi:MAG: hypothetical protein ACTS5F_00490 [Candidatus Hodgkinia cicadicola]